jgi:hypothetical protein
MIEETSEKSGETCSPRKTLKRAAINDPLVETFLEVLTKGR